MICNTELLDEACSRSGLEVRQTVEEYREALQLGCFLCQTVRDDCESNRKYRDDAFCRLANGDVLIKNVKCRKSGDKESPYTGLEIPINYDFDALVMKTTDALDPIYFDIEALDGIMPP